MSFEIGDKVQLRFPTGWGYFGVVLGVKSHWGYPDEFTIRWEGEFMPDGDRIRYPCDFGVRIETIDSCADLTYFEPQEWSCHS